MSSCVDCRPLLLDAAYGLLEPGEVTALDAHVAGCPECAAAAAEVARQQELIARAAKCETVNFTFQAETLADVRLQNPAPLRSRPWGRYALAASALLAFGLFAVPTARDLSTASRAAAERAAHEQLLAAKRAELTAARAESARIADAAKQRFEQSRAAHDGLVKEWVRAERDAARQAAGRPFRLKLTGPATAVAGAPNEYAWEVTDREGKAVDLNVRAELRDGGRALYVSTTPPGKPSTKGNLRIPPEVWAGVAPGADLRLVVSGQDPKSGATEELSEPVALAEPPLTTFLSTDKPLYRPGETVYFRSLTLDRAHFLPPKRDVGLFFRLVAPGGKPVEAMQVAGVARSDAKLPNGEPVRGVGGGAFALPAELAGGEYELQAFDVPPTDGKLPAGARPAASRKLIVHQYTPERLLKTLTFGARSYGPGDEVTAKFTVADQGKPLAGAAIQIDAVTEAGGQTKKHPVDADPKVTPADGSVLIRWKLPVIPGLRSARVAVVVKTASDEETLVRPVPLATRTLDVAFFPEGGDLVAGVPNVVYFRAQSDAGKPAELRGVLTDGTNDVMEIATAVSADAPLANQGLGRFTFTPEAGKRYAVRLTAPLGVEQPKGGYELPEAKADGLALSVAGVTEPGKPISVELHAAGAARSVLVGAYLRGQSVAHARAALEPGKRTTLTLDPGADARGGVVRVTVFEEPRDEPGRREYKAVAERLVFRRPQATLNLDVAVNHADAKRSGPFVPGEAAQLTVQSKREDGAPVPAVLWAAVVNQSTVTMADDRTERSLPTHFLLTGEVRRPEELENADFLLTAHPDAARSLDLLLGTQGWRRFAEQAPGVFQNKGDDEAEQVRVAFGGVGVPPASWGDRAQRVFRAYQPKYEAALAELERAEREAKAPSLPDGLTNKLALTHGEVESAEREVRSVEYEQRSAYRRVNDRAVTFGFAVPLLAGFVFGLRTLFRARTLGAVALGVALAGSVVVVAAAFVLTPVQKVRSAAVRGTAREFPEELLELDPQPGAEGSPIPREIPRPTPPPPSETKNRTGSQLNTIRRTRLLPNLGPAVTDVVNPRPAEKPAAPALAKPPAKLIRATQDAIDQGISAVEAADFTQKLLREWPQLKPFPVREYAHRPAAPAGDVRADMTETLVWQPLLVTDVDGRAKVDFHLSDAVAPYRVLVAGHTLDGRIGSATRMIEVRKSLEVDAKLPPEVGARDTLLVPVRANAVGAGPARITVAPRGFDVAGDASRTIALNGGAGRTFVGLTPNQPEGTAVVAVSGTHAAGTDAVERSVRIAPDGFPVYGAVSGTLSQPLTATVTVPPHLMRGTLKVGVTVYPNTLSELQGGLDGLLREPSGCFEQTSTTNYPNVMISQYLKERKLAAPEAGARAAAMLDRGYQRLTGYECPSTPTRDRRGFEWFGAADRQHDALTAYGLLQFTDMGRVHPVDPEMLKRTRAYLLSLRDGQGGFRRDGQSSHAFGMAPKEVADAYVVWAVTEADRGVKDPPELAKEFGKLLGEARASADPYFVALVANTALLRGDAAGAELLRKLAAKQAADGSVPGAATSITRSGGRNLLTETTALTTLAWLKGNGSGAFAEPVRKAVAWLGAQRGGFGDYGSTQATVLALKAIVENDRNSRRDPESGELRLFAAGNLVASRPFSTDDPGVVTLDVPDAEAVLAAGPQEVRVETTGRGAFPATVRWEAFASRPPSSEGCAVGLDVALPDRPLAEGEAARLTVRVANRRDAELGMVVAVVGIPAGLQLPADGKGLKELTERKDERGEPLLSFWETRGRELVLYWRGMAPKEALELGVDVVAHTPGTYRGPASRAYLYYDADAKTWADPLTADVAPPKE